MTSLPAIMQVRPSGPTGARIMIVGEAPGEQEVLKGEPFVGTSGVELTKMLHEAGIMRSECFLTNVARSRPFANDISTWFAQTKKDIAAKLSDPSWSWLNGRLVAPQIAQGVELLRKEIELVQPNVIIAFGNTALWALTGIWGAGDWRGSVLPCTLVQGPKVVPSYHPASVLRQWSWRVTCVQDLRRAAKEAKSRELVRPDYRFIIRPDYATVMHVINSQLALLDQGPRHLSIDIETRGGHIACVGFAWSTTEAICIPLMDIHHWEGYWSEEEEVGVCMALQKLLTHPNLKGSGQNFLYDAQYFWRHMRFKPRIWMDTMITWHVAYAGQPKALDYQASLICESYRFWKQDGKEWNAKGLGEEQLWSYNCEDCVRTFEIAESHAKTIPELGLEYPFEFQMTMFWLVLDTMIRGVRFDQSRRSEFAMLLQDEIAKRDQWFIDVLGHPLKPSSNKQMKALFYDDLKLPVQKNRKTGNPALDDEALRKIVTKAPLAGPLVRKISEWRSLGVFFSTFVQAPLDSDGRMRCSYNIAGTDTFRFSSSENAFGSGTNLQNIPKGGEDSDGFDLPNVRSLFLPDKGKIIFDTDLSSADLRIVVWESDEPEMKQILADGNNPYIMIAREFYHDPTIQKKLPSGVEHPKYRTFKSLAHGTHYLGSPRGLAMRLGLSVNEVERVQRWYFGRFPRIREWQEHVKDTLRRHHYITNVFGYRKFYFDRIDDDVFREAAAWIPQSSVALYINHIWARFAMNIPGLEILMQVHDNLVGQFDKPYKDFYLRRMAEESAKVVLPYSDPLIIPLEVKISENNWGECE